MIAKKYRDDRSAPARAQGNIIFSVFRMFANVRARAPRGTKNGREEKIRSVEQKGPRLSPSHARKVEERGESGRTRVPLSMLRGEFEGQSLVC